jgi:hypothetical protein
MENTTPKVVNQDGGSVGKNCSNVSFTSGSTSLNGESIATVNRNQVSISKAPDVKG